MRFSVMQNGAYPARPRLAQRRFLSLRSAKLSRAEWRGALAVTLLDHCNGRGGVESGTERLASRDRRYDKARICASPELAKKGTLRLAPSPKLEGNLRKDYEKMREMYFGREPEFDAVMNDVRRLEETFNEQE